MLNLTLVAALCASLALNGVQYVQSGNQNPSQERFIFSFNAPYIRNGTLIIDVTMDWQPEMLFMNVVVNDDIYYGGYLGISFNKQRTFCLYSDNTALWSPDAFVCENGMLSGPEIKPYSSPFHNCTFTEGVGYTYDIKFPREEVVFSQPVMIHLVYWDTLATHYTTIANSFVWVEFQA